MRILHIVPAYQPAIQWGGPVVSVSLLARQQARRGHTVSVWTTTFGLEQNVTQSRTLDGVAVTYFRSLALGHWFIPLGLARTLHRQLDQFDLVHIHMVWDPICWLAARTLVRQRRPFIISPRGSIESSLIERRSSTLKFFLYRFLLRNLFIRANGFHFTAAVERERFEDFTQLQPRAVVIPNCLELQPYEHRADKTLLNQWNLDQQPYLLYLGRLSWKKGFEFLVPAFARFHQRQPNYRLVIAGPDESGYQSKIERWVREQGLAPATVFTGLVVGEEKLALLQSATAFVLPSYSENFGMAVIEAMAAGVPVVISQAVGLAELIKRYQAGLIVELEVGALADALVELATNPTRRTELVRNGERLIREQFDPDHVVVALEQFYTEVLQ